MLPIKIFLTISAIVWLIYQCFDIYRFAAKLAAFSRVVANSRKSHTYTFEIYRYIAEYRFISLIAFGLTGLILVAFALLEINYQYVSYGILTLLISFFAESSFSYKWGAIREQVKNTLSDAEFMEIDKGTNYKTTNDTSLTFTTIATIGFLPTALFLFIVWY